MAGVLNIVYTAAALLVAIGGIAAVNWLTPAVSSKPGVESEKLSSTSITIGVILFLLATAALVVTA